MMYRPLHALYWLDVIVDASGRVLSTIFSELK